MIETKKVCVGVGVIIWKDGKFLIGQRKASHGIDTWTAPGGWIDKGESFAEAAEREVLEETGLRINNVRFLSATNNILPDDDMHTVTIWMESDWLSGNPIITEPDKFINHTWCDPKSLPSPLFVALSELKKIKPEMFLT